MQLLYINKVGPIAEETQLQLETKNQVSGGCSLPLLLTGVNTARHKAALSTLQSISAPLLPGS